LLGRAAELWSNGDRPKERAMSSNAIRIPTLYEELEALPEHVTGEIIGGELHVSPRPAARHAVSASAGIAQLLPEYSWSGGNGGTRWVLLAEPELHLLSDVLVPDMAGWRSERLGDYRTWKFFDVAPDWVCEILSPSTALRDRTVKTDAYALHGVPWLWYVDPELELIEAFQLVDGSYVRTGAWHGDSTAHIPPFESLGLVLARWWGREPAPPEAPTAATDTAASETLAKDGTQGGDDS
jgi:Uma2 family endonuclease